MQRGKKKQLARELFGSGFAKRVGPKPREAEDEQRKGEKEETRKK